LAYKIYSDEELRGIAERIVVHRMSLTRDPDDEANIRREVYRVLTAVGIANRAACMLENRRLGEFERPDLIDADVPAESCGPLCQAAAALVTNCFADSDPGLPTDDNLCFAPAEVTSRLYSWAAAADAAAAKGAGT
jgi:hypothetical protein